MPRKQTISKKKNYIRVDLNVLFVKEGDYIVAYCPALELSSYGDNEDEAKSAFEASLKIFLDETSRKGTLEKVLLKLGWSLTQVPEIRYEPPKLSQEDLLILKSSKNVITEQVALPL